MYNKIFSKYGLNVLDYTELEKIRLRKNKKSYFAPQKGGQETLMTSNANIVIYGGVRGGGKSAGLILNTFYYVCASNFSGVIFRKEKNDSKKGGGMESQSKVFLNEFGRYRESSNDMSWVFDGKGGGGNLSFGYYSDKYDDFVNRYRGSQLSYIGIDEITQMPYSYFKFLLTCNRNSGGLENKIIGTCNPDPSSWIARFIGGGFTNQEGEKKLKWIGEDGFPIQENDGKILYCYMYGEREDLIYWGETKEDVYEQAKDKIDALWTPELSEFGEKLDMFIFSVTFIAGKLTDNKILLSSDSTYFKNLAQQSQEQQQRDLKGNWKFQNTGDALINLSHLDTLFANQPQRSGERYVTCDVSTKEHGDPFVLILWDGFHMCDMEYFNENSDVGKVRIRQILEKWGVLEQDFCFDATGSGSHLCSYFDLSMQFIANSKAFDTKLIMIGSQKQNISAYENVRGQCVDNFARRIRNGGYSVEEMLLTQKFGDKMLYDHLREEHIIIAKDNKKNNKFKAIDKKDVAHILGHSPNVMDTMFQREYIELYRGSAIGEVEQEGIWFL